jgi:cell division protein FtsA
VDKTVIAIDIGSGSITSIVAQNDYNNKINILGIGKSQSSGINKGSIVDIDKAATAIKDSVDLAKSSYDSKIDETFISISGINTRSIRSHSSINVPSGQITIKEIKQVLLVALYDAQIVPEYEAIHVIPLYFKVDDNNSISNPLNMNGSRLEVYANIITVKKTSITNIKSALKKSNLEDVNLILKSYASSIGTLNDDQKKLGTLLIDLGNTTCDFTITNNKSIIFNDTISIGAHHISNDLSIILRTPLDVADEIKKNYSSLLPRTDEKITKVKVRLIGNEDEQESIPLDYVQTIIHARVEETLSLIEQKISNNALTEHVNNIILTGGMSKIEGIDLLTKKIFNDTPVQIQNPHPIQNGYINFNDPSLSTIVGILMYALDSDPAFELNSKRELREKVIKVKPQQQYVEEKPKEETVKQEQQTTQKVEDNSFENIGLEHAQESAKNEKQSFFNRMMKKFSEWL